MKIHTIQAINADDIPDELEEECESKGIYLHCACEMHSIVDDGSPFSEWLKTQGFKFEADKPCTWIGVWGT